MSDIIDISPPLNNKIPVWPGDTPFEFKSNWTLEGDCPVNVGSIKGSTHTGAHADAPLHYSNEGKSIDEVDLDRYIGHCFVIDARTSQGIIGVEDVLASLPQKCERVLFKTYTKAPVNNWDEDFTAISPGLIDLLASRGCVLVGIDTPSIDPQNSKTLEAHKSILSNDINVLEGLVLDSADPGVYELIALPLRIEGADASPVRAILREL